MRIIFSGGGTLGPVMPLIAVYQELKKQHPDWQYLWVGTKNGPEERLIKSYNLEYRALPSAKLRRYASWQNLWDFFVFWLAFFQARRLIKKFQPSVLFTAGGFVSVPLHLAAWCQKKTTVVHQQDVRAGLANKVMAHFANYVTTSLPASVKQFPKRKTIWLGNPVRPGVLRGSRVEAIRIFGLDPSLPTVLVLGGGTGALSLNKLISRSLGDLLDYCQIIHMTGRGKEMIVPNFAGSNRDELLKHRYHPVQFLEEDFLAHAYAAADLVVARAGFSTLSELAALGKAVLPIPICSSHQEDNARYFAERSGALVFYENKETREAFVLKIKQLLADPGELKIIGYNMSKIMPKEATAKIAFLLEEAGLHAK